MTVETFNKRPGEPPMADQPDGSVMTVHGDVTPEWVRLPSSFGGQRARVLETVSGPCVCCQHPTYYRVLDARDPTTNRPIAVTECPTRSLFLWMTWSPSDA